MMSPDHDPADGARTAPLPPGEYRLPADERWWPALADLLLEHAPRTVAAAPDLGAAVVLVPSADLAPVMRRAVQQRLPPGAGRAACLAPRILTLADWTGVMADPTPAQPAELYQALRANAWVRERFGTQPAALWSLAHDIAALTDELSLFASGADQAYGERWRSAVQRQFSQRAAALGEPQTQLVLALWQAGYAQARGTGLLRERLAQRARRAQGPLFWLAPQGALQWQRDYCLAYGRRSGYPAWVVSTDARALAQRQPWLTAAWPELLGPLEAAAPIAQRAAAGRPPLAPDAGAAPCWPPAPWRIWPCATLEIEASAAASWTLAQVRAGSAAIALVALDRLAARRVRALLERAGIAVADDTGWKLSTTSAAGAVVRWLDVVLADFAQGELLDWVRSPFVAWRGLDAAAELAAGADHGAVQDAAGAAAADLRAPAAVAASAAALDRAGVVNALSNALLRAGVYRGVAAVRAAAARGARPAPADLVATKPAQAGSGGVAADQAAVVALALVDTLVGLARKWQQLHAQRAELGRYLELLDATLHALGMRDALAADAVGCQVLAALDTLRAALADSALRLALPEFRAFLAQHFENHHAVAVAPGAAVRMTTLAATRLRRYDAALLIGVDADHLPGCRSAAGLLAQTVRRDLGLPTASAREREQLLDLANLLAATPVVAATWRAQVGAEPRPLSPWLDRLDLVHRLGSGQSLRQAPPEAWRSGRAAPALARAPRAPGALPARISAGAYQDLVDCPYRFFGLRVLGLKEHRRSQERADKRDLGTLLHTVLERFHRAVAAGSMRADAAGLHQQIDAVVEPLLAQRPTLLAYSLRLHLLVPAYLEWLARDSAQGWRWAQGEVELARSLELYPAGSADADCATPSAAGTVRSHRRRTLSGSGALAASAEPHGAGRVVLCGRVDRIDRRVTLDQHAPTSAIGAQRILDYKVGDARALQRAQQAPGEANQLYFYGLLLEGLSPPLPTEAAYLSLQLKAETGQPARGSVSPVPAPGVFAAQVAQLAGRLRSDLRRIDAGAALPAHGAETVCRRCALRSLCRHGQVEASDTPGAGR